MVLRNCIVLAAVALGFAAPQAAGTQPGAPSAAPGAAASDIGWPRVYEKNGKTLTVHQPQIDSWKDYTTIHFRCAIAIGGVLKDEKLGVAEVQATTSVDFSTRSLTIMPTSRDIRIPNVSDEERALLRAAVEEIHPAAAGTIISLDRVLACLDASKQSVQRQVPVSLDPPRIYYSDQPAILVMFMGSPKFEPVSKDNPNIQFAVNTNWDVLLDARSKQYYVLDGDGWITTSDPLYGAWSPTTQLPLTADALPNDDNWTEVRKHMPGTPPGMAPRVFVATGPAELIVTTGSPELRPISGTQLSRVINTDSTLFQHAGNGNYYYLVAGRWFSAGSLSGPWSAASGSLPADFSAIPDTDESAFVKASVPGTQLAQDAVLLASVPNRTVVDIHEKTVEVAYSGQPQFQAIDGTGVQYAVNTPFSVFLVGNSYYCCDQGVWFTSPAATGPWALCSSVPPAIYTIPASNPHYNVTYVTVQASSPTSVTYAQTAGYSGEYVSSTGVLMFGAGMLVGAAIASDSHVYYPPYPCYYSYGCGAAYHYGYGGFYGGAHACYGPYGGAGYAAAYNPATGTYARGAAAYGPYGSAAAGAAYNPYTGTRAARAQVNTAYGSAGRSAAYNPATNTYARAGYSSGAYGTAGAAVTNKGTGAAAWDTQNSQGAVAKTRSGDVYATNGDTVYKRDSGGGWSSNSGSGWQSAPRPEPTSRSADASSFESQAASRERGSRASESAKSFRSSGGFQSQGEMRGSRSRPSGGGRRR